MNGKHLGLTTALFGMLGLGIRIVADYVPSHLGNSLTEGSAPVWLPTHGMVGQTVLIYHYLFGALGMVLFLGLGLGVGYALANSFDLLSEFRWFARTVLGGYGVGVVVGFALFGSVQAVLSSSSSALGGVGIDLFLLVLVTSLIVEVALPLAIATIAGAALAHFDTASDSSQQTVEADQAASSSVRTGSPDH